MSPTESANSSKNHDSVPNAAGRRTRVRFAVVLFILLSMEIGVFLFVVPWSEIWDRNLLLGYYPSLRPIYLSHYLRGAVSGLGLMNLWLGISQAWNLRRPVAHSAGR